MRKKRRWKLWLNRLLTFTIIAVLTPLLVTIVMQRMRLEQVIYGEQGNTDEAEQIEAALVGMVAKEIDIQAETEAIAAQCVVARTNYYDAMERGLELPETMTEEEMRQTWGDDFDKNYQKIEACVQETGYQVLTWKDETIYAAYHTLSAGQTRNMSDVYSNVKMPYLTSAVCAWDVTAEGYLKVYYLEKSEIVEKCREKFPEAEIDVDADPFPITVEARDEAEYVTSVKIGDKSCSGEEFRTCMDLPSSCFSITELDGKIRIVTKGIGHGLGLSIHSAMEMAKEGMGYEEILSYFYPQTKIKEMV